MMLGNAEEGTDDYSVPTDLWQSWEHKHD